jgi:hypothetical protein
MVTRYAVIQGGTCTNIVLWDGDTAKWTPPQGATVVPFDPAVHIIATPVDVANAATLRQALILGATADLAFINAAKPSTAAAQASAAYDAAVRCSRQLRSLILLQVLADTSDISGT